MGGYLKVGIPRGLFWYYMPGGYDTFWEAVGFEVITSPPTNRWIFEEGIRSSQDELCLPVKVFHGHIAFLKDKVDIIFIPRVVDAMKGGKRRFGCPKFIGLPELIKSSISSLPPIISVDLTLAKDGIERCFLKLGSLLGIKAKVIKKAVREMLNLERKTRPFRYSPDKGYPVKIGIVGHPYLIYDPYLSGGFLDKLSSLKIDYITSSELPNKLIEERIEIATDLYWIYERELIGAAYLFVQQGEIDGLIHCVSFGCGPGSIVMEMLQRRVIKGKKLPFFTLVMDENIGEAGLLTRLEAFCDMVRVNKR